jgi:hypothetical protein
MGPRNEQYCRQYSKPSLWIRIQVKLRTDVLKRKSLLLFPFEEIWRASKSRQTICLHLLMFLFMTSSSEEKIFLRWPDFFFLRLKFSLNWCTVLFSYMGSLANSEAHKKRVRILILYGKGTLAIGFWLKG